MSANDEKYNGWTNYATWRVNLEIVDDYVNYALVPDRQSFRDLNELSGHLSDYVDDIVSEQGDGLAVDYARAFLSDVDWYEIAEHHAADNPELLDSDDDDTCSQCGASLDDGEGYDGLCGNCADKADDEN